jgi:hypothetical protein
VINFILEVLICQDSHPVNQESDFFIKCIFFVLQTLLGVPLSIGKEFLLFAGLFLEPRFLVEGWKEIAVARVPAIVADVVRRVPREQHIERVIGEQILRVGDQYKVFVSTRSRLKFGVQTHLSIYDQN